MIQPAPTPKTLNLSHPVTSQPTQARQVGYIYDRGRAIGLELDFGDGKPVQLRYEKIAELRKAAAEEQRQ